MSGNESSHTSAREKELEAEVTRLNNQNGLLKKSLENIKEMTINRSRSMEFNRRRNEAEKMIKKEKSNC